MRTTLLLSPLCAFSLAMRFGRSPFMPTASQPLMEQLQEAYRSGSSPPFHHHPVSAQLWLTLQMHSAAEPQPIYRREPSAFSGQLVVLGASRLGPNSMRGHAENTHRRAHC